MTNFLFKFKKPFFWPSFGPFSPIFGSKKFFLKKLGCHIQLHKGFWHHFKIQRNLIGQFQENTQTDQEKGKKDRPYFTGSFCLLPRVCLVRQQIGIQKSKTQSMMFGLTKNYCITVSMQKISSIHKLIQQILDSHEQMAMPIFGHAHPKIIEITFTIPKFAPACRKISSFHQFILQMQSILESCNQTGHTPKKFDQPLIYVNLYQHAKNQAISLICSGDMVLIKKLAI